MNISQRSGRFALFVSLLSLPIFVFSQPFSEQLFKDMKWRSIGPFRGGRVLAVEGIPGEPNTYYFGAVAGGIWKTVNGGVSWTPLFDKEPVSSIGSLAVAPSNHNVLYAGTGEACIRGNISFGDGVYKSMDGGKTWKNVGLRDSRHIGSVIVHPQNPDVVFVAALGHAFGPNSERGVFRTTDGGKNWEKVLYKDENTGGIDVTFDPNNPGILFAALWQARRQPWHFSSGGPGSGLYKSVDGGTTWKRLEGHGLPEGLLGRIGVSVSGADSNRVYALVEAKEGGLFRSDDGGETWTRANDDERFHQRAWYFTHVFADPKAVDTVYTLNTGLFRSNDGGKTFALLPAPHGDHHALWIDPTNPQRMINGNDGGVTVTADGGMTWTRQDNQPTGQFYHVITDDRFPYRVYGSQQDNTSVGVASMNEESGVIGQQDWYSVEGGESGFIALDPREPDVYYATSYMGYVLRYDQRTRQTQDVSPWPLDTSGHNLIDAEHRFQWTQPLLVSAHDPSVLFMTGERVFKSTNQGMSWAPISPDLTRNDKSKQGDSGGPITRDMTGTEYYDTISALAQSPLERGVLWVGTDDGLVHVTRDEGKTWSEATPKSAPQWGMISSLDPSHFDSQTAYAAVDRHKLDDFHPYIYKTEDDGKTWTVRASGIPDHAYVHAVREDPVRRGLLYAGTETGMYVSFDDGQRWQPLQLNLPTTPIYDLVVKNDDLVVATHGRSFWILDDVTPLRQIDPQVASADVFLYKPRPTYRLHVTDFVWDKGQPVGQNPPKIAVINYYFKEKPKEEVTLEILDSQGKLVRKFFSRKRDKVEQPPEWPQLEKPVEVIAAEAGMNRFAWDLRYESPVEVPGAFYSGNPPQGPLALPGNYQVRLTAGGKAQTAVLEVKLDPRVRGSAADLQKNFDLALKLRDRMSDLHEAVNQIRVLRAQLQTLRARFDQQGQGKEVVAAAQALDDRMTSIEQELIQTQMKSSEGNLNYPNKLNEQFYTLQGSVESADASPTQPEYAVYDQLGQRLDEQLGKWAEIMANQVPALNQMAQKGNAPFLFLACGTNAGSCAPSPEHGLRQK